LGVRLESRQTGRAAGLCDYLCKEFKLDPMKDGVIIGHFEGFKRGIASNHADPSYWFPKHGENMDTLLCQEMPSNPRQFDLRHKLPFCEFPQDVNQNIRIVQAFACNIDHVEFRFIFVAIHPQYIEDSFTQDIQNYLCILFVQSCRIFPENDIQLPVHTLNSPFPASNNKQFLCRKHS
jgi:hypothetical protein